MESLENLSFSPILLLSAFDQFFALERNLYYILNSKTEKRHELKFNHNLTKPSETLKIEKNETKEKTQTIHKAIKQIEA